MQSSFSARFFAVMVSVLLVAALGITLLINQSAEGASQSTGAQYASSVGDNNSFGSAGDAFGAPDGNCNDSDDCAEVGQGQTGEYDDYQFSILGGPVVLGIEVTVSGTPGTNDAPKVRLLDANGDPIGDQKTLSTSGSFSTQTVGGSADLWGTTWSEATVEDVDFGVEVTDSGGTGGGFLLDAIGITIHYDNDLDNDGVLNDVDNCITTPNSDQLNADEHLAANGARMGPTPAAATVAPLPSDAAGDACDSDDDNDGYSDTVEEHIRTNPLDNCYGGPTPLSTPAGYTALEINDGFPSDISADKKVTEDDLNVYYGVMGLNIDTVLRQRLDGSPSSKIDISDVLTLLGGGRVGWVCQ